MANPVSGVFTTVTWDADGAGAGAAVAVNLGSTYEYDEETQTEEQGPFFNQAEIIEIATGDKVTLKLEGSVPETTATGLDALYTARVNRTRGTLLIDTIKGKKITLTNTLIKKYSLKGDAKGSVTFSIEATGAGAVTAGSAS